MIRTRDFLLFGLAIVFLSGGIGLTVIADILESEGQTAAIIEFAAAADPTGAEAILPTHDKNNTLQRLRQKLARGEGVKSGPPIFTSVDDQASTAPAVTDQTAPSAVLMGQDMVGRPLMSNDLWRFVGFSSNDQIGVAENGVPIYGARNDALPLDVCGGADEGAGYRYHIKPGEALVEGCFGGS